MAGRSKRRRFLGGSALVFQLLIMIAWLHWRQQPALGVTLTIPQGGCVFGCGVLLSIYRQRILELPEQIAKHEGCVSPARLALSVGRCWAHAVAGCRAGQARSGGSSSTGASGYRGSASRRSSRSTWTAIAPKRCTPAAPRGRRQQARQRGLRSAEHSPDFRYRSGVVKLPKIYRRPPRTPSLVERDGSLDQTTLRLQTEFSARGVVRKSPSHRRGVRQGRPGIRLPRETHHGATETTAKTPEGRDEPKKFHAESWSRGELRKSRSAAPRENRPWKKAFFLPTGLLPSLGRKGLESLVLTKLARKHL